ncbi:MAG: HEAT repeat domain-containing protein [Terriglobia bacterium]
MTCNDAQQNMSLDIYGDLAAPERDALEAHAAGCAACRAEWERARRLHSLLIAEPAAEAPPGLLVRCRRALEISLDREQHGWRRWLAGSRSLLYHPSSVAAAVILIAFGFGLGWSIRPRAGRFNTMAEAPGAVARLAAPASADLGTISSISQVSQDPQSEKIRITLDAEHRVTLEGSLDDPRIRQILVDTMKSYSNPGIRLDTVNALKQNPENPSVEDALLYAMRHDPNAGVRLEALRSVPKMKWAPQVQSALIETIQQDQNPGVRVAAIDNLVKHALDERDQAMVPILQNFASNDSNPYVRVKALTAVHELARGD